LARAKSLSSNGSRASGLDHRRKLPRLHRRKPSVGQEAKDGFQAVTKYFWGFFDTAKFTKSKVPDCEARGWKCNDQHMYAGLCADLQKAERDGPLRVNRMFCVCLPCSLLDFERCEMTAMMGRSRPVTVPLPRNTPSRVSQLESLDAWAKVLKPGMVVAVRAPAAEHGLEGSFWLALIMSEAFPVTEDMVHQSAEYEAGFLVVKAKYYSLEQRSPRGYVLKDEEWILDVNAMIRLPNVIFSGGSVGKAPRESRSALHILEEDWVNRLNETRERVALESCDVVMCCVALISCVRNGCYAATLADFLALRALSM